MGYDIYTKVGFGIALAKGAADNFDESDADSPAWIEAHFEPSRYGVTIENGGSCEDPYPIVFIAASVLKIDPMNPTLFVPADEATRREWSYKVYAYLDKWRLRDKMREPGAIPSYLVALYHSC